jgi:hypothetical protein
MLVLSLPNYYGQLCRFLFSHDVMLFLQSQHFLFFLGYAASVPQPGFFFT